MTDKEMNREIRKQRRLEKLQSNAPVCGTCGEADYRVLERHHVAGRKHDPATVVICRNCHRKVTDEQKDHPSCQPGAESPLHAIGLFLLGLADLLELIIEKLSEFGLALIERVAPETGEARP